MADKPKPKYKLTSFDVREISFVREGAVLEDFLLIKNKEGGKKMPNDVKTPEQIAAEQLEAEKAKAEAEIKAKADADEKAKIEADAKAKADADAAKAAEADAGETVEKSKYVEIEKEKQRLEAELSKIKEEKELEVFKSKAGEFKSLKAEGLDLADVLFKCKKALDEKTFEAIEKTLNVADKAIEKGVAFGGLFVEIGKSTESDNDGKSELDKKAEAIAKDKGISFEKAFVMACEQNPELYKEVSEKKNGGK